MRSPQCTPGQIGNHQCTGVGALDDEVLYCQCYCHNVKRGFLWVAIANLFGSG